MPRPIAFIALASGIAVVGFGIVLITLGPRADDDLATMPRATLEPGAGTGDRGDVTGTGVRGTVVDRDADPVADVEVTLVPLFMDDRADPIRTTTDTDGRFSFDEVAVDPGSPWIAEATFDGARFPSDVLRTPRGKDNPVRIVVAPTTKKADDIEIRLESLAVVGDRSGGQAVHALTVVNRGKRAYVGGLRLPLLHGATSIQEGGGLDRRYLELGTNEMTSTAPLLPGRHDLTYTYIVQMARGGISIDHRTSVDTDRYELLVGDGLSLDAAAPLHDDGEVTLGPRGAQRTYHRFIARDLSNGHRVEARITVATSSGLVQIGAYAFAALLALIVIAAPILRRRRKRDPGDGAPVSPPPTPVADAPAPNPPA